MKILITGASGFVGRKLVSYLASIGHTGYAVSRGPLSTLPIGWSWLQRDAVLSGTENLGDDDPVDWVIHLEVKQHVLVPTARDVALFSSINVAGVKRWLDWCDARKIERFLLFSTIKAAGSNGVDLEEMGSGSPDTLYGLSKQKAEILVRDWVQSNQQRTGVIARPAVIYGPENQANMFEMLKGIDRGTFALVGRNNNIKSIVALDNVCAAVAHIVSREKRGGRLYNVVDAKSFSVRSLAMMMSVALGKGGRPKTVPLWIARCIACFGDGISHFGLSFPLTTSRLRSLLEDTYFRPQRLLDEGFVHPIRTEDGLANMVKWYINTRSK